MQLQLLIDRMIDQAHEVDPGGTYSILIGKAPATELEWVRGKKVYRWCQVVQTRLVPNYAVVLAPSPDNLRNSDLIEFHGHILDGDVTRHTIRRGVETDLPARPDIGYCSEPLSL
ncbi:MAG: hypothetical protein LH605_02915 [Microbacteriaceae bacterium]|nr:hypothetical protein [Microbacteriaceae bacterium]